MNGITGKKPSLAITIRSFTPDAAVEEILKSRFDIRYVNTSGKRLSEDELSSAIRGADAVIAGTEEFTRSVIDASPQLRMISRVGVGTDSIDLDTAAKQNIRILITAASAIQPVAEHTLALIFCVSRRLAEYYTSARVHDHRVKQASLLFGKTVGIIGIGRIGSRVGELVLCLGCPVIYYDPFVTTSPNPAFTRAGSLDELFQKADIITLHVPAKKGDKALLDREAFNQCRNGVIIINTARGSLVDEQALSEALDSGKVAGAGLDVTAEEPYNGPLLSFPHVVITPHVASNTTESRKAMEREAVDNILNAISGECR